ncbi:MAG: diadenosine tetraphosphatase [Gammaproteobacteria bacterium]|nr:MAG: diadenosine tetraphosphatase [Gammaproteobacteria bacterium]RLA11188.1 MAG: diadenosine tetraphosphatase [Gammaproteobacteria bacterium]
MATWAIGDIQGCFDELQQLLRAIEFDPAHDCLWFVGDLVNRGPKSLETLRFIRDLADTATVVLGNHDFHLLAVAAGVGRLHKKDTLQPILDAPDREELLDWLRFRPLMHYHADLGYAMVHAGLAPTWDLHAALGYAAEVESVLRSDNASEFYQVMYSEVDDCWSDTLTGNHRLRVITDYFARVRFCLPDGCYSVQFKGPPGGQPVEYLPWFDLPQRATAGLPIIFGHWSSLGVVDNSSVVALDTGCLWGRQLSAFCLDEPCWVRIQCPQYAK